ncbi:MAG: FeoA domain-containing protein, partial [Spirochaetaceae bacterium]|nr:FeoA domain-containing protein [Spirochaetaceae bacterium]
MKTLKGASVGQKVRVVKLHGQGPIRRRLMDMGLIRGTAV